MKGIVLLVVSGILVMLSLAASAMASLALRLHRGAAAGLDQAQARLLACSGIEYGSARLMQDSSPALAPSAGNQADDWTYRDGPGIPLERALNPSYAQAELYSETPPANGRYEPGVDSYRDWNGNGRFDSWSGRIRGRNGMTSGMFILKVSGESAEGSLNVNSGILDPLRYVNGVADYDLNLNGVPDYRDLGAAGLPEAPQGVPPLPGGLLDPASRLAQESGAVLRWNPKDEWARNRRIAQAINQLGLILGIATPRPGGRIIAHRPPGGYRAIEELSGLFPQPDWARLKPYLAVAGRPNRWVPYFHNIDEGVSDRYGGILEGPDRQFSINAADAAVETTAALSSMMKRGRIPHYPNLITPSEAVEIARFLKETPFVSWFDLYRKLQAVGWLFAASPLAKPQDKAAWAHAIACPEECGYESPFRTPAWDWSRYGGIAPRARKCQIFDDEVFAAGPAASLGFSPLSVFSLQSLGRSGPGRAAASAAASGLLRLSGAIEARSQADFENLGAANLPGRGHPASGASGRPFRDRTTTAPCFSRDACPDLDPERDPFTPVGTERYSLISGQAYTGGPTTGSVVACAYAFEYCPFYGEVMLQNRCWTDGEEAFYQPCWDLDQPERPPADRASLRFRQNFDDFSPRKAVWRRGNTAGAESISLAQGIEEKDLKGRILRTGKVDPYDGSPSVAPSFFDEFLGSGWFTFRWKVDAAPDSDANAGYFPLSDTTGRVAEGTVEGWFNAIAGTTVGGCAVYLSSNDLDTWPRLRMERASWRQTDGKGTTLSSTTWSVPAADPFDWITFAVGGGRVDIYRNGVWQAWAQFFPDAIDASSFQRVENGGLHTDGLRIYPRNLNGTPSLFGAHASRGRFWTPLPESAPPPQEGKDLRRIPRFGSALYRFSEPVEPVHAGWDGFVPPALAQAAETWNRDHAEEPAFPIRVELVLYRQGVPIVVPFPAESWETGGCRVDFRALWAASHPGRPLPKIEAMAWQVWMDASSLDLARFTPVFDGIELEFRGKGAVLLGAGE